jgi:hypothetical protein
MVFWVLALNFSPVWGEVLFEGYYKVNLADVHSGYAIQKYEFNPSAKEFTSTYFVYLRTKPDGSKFSTESLKAKSNDKFQPLNFQYTAILEGKPVQIDAKFKGQKLTGTLKKDGRDQALNRTIDKGAFLSTMLLQLVLQNGLKVGKGFVFKAIAEEDAQQSDGNAKVEGQMKYKGRDVFQLSYTFKGISSVAKIDTAGQVLFSEARAQGVSTELVASADEAKAGFSFPEKTLKTLFGEVPAGRKNSLVSAPLAPAPSPVSSPSSSPSSSADSQ